MKSLLTIAAVGLAACAALTGSAGAAIVITYEAPGATNTTANYVGGVETFDGQSGPSFTSTFGGSLVTGNYSGVAISTAGQYGGAGGTGNYALALDSSTPVSYSLSLSTTGQPIDYFGFWLSAADPSNTVTMTTSQGSYVFSAAEVLNAIAARPDAGGYLGNPGGPFEGQNGAQDYVFINFFDTTGSISKIVFSQSVGYAGFESDNHTVGHYIGAITGFSVPEPAAWALMLVGVAGLGGVARLRRAKSLAIV
jgi:hypothetical protein